MHISLADGWGRCGLFSTLSGKLTKECYSGLWTQELAVTILSSFPPPLCFVVPYSCGRTSYHPGDSLALLCLSKLFAKEGKHFYTRHSMWSRVESERECELWVQGLFQLSVKCSCLWGWVQLWNNRHHYCKMCQDEERIHCSSEKRTSYRAECNYSNGRQPVHLGSLSVANPNS